MIENGSKVATVGIRSFKLDCDINTDDLPKLTVELSLRTSKYSYQDILEATKKILDEIKNISVDLENESMEVIKCFLEE